MDDRVVNEEVQPYPAITAQFDNKIDPDNLFDYEGQDIPNYIKKDNTASNRITNKGATLGRVLFYDVNLSIDNSLSCASCHQQATGFSDKRTVSEGINGTTSRHSMRLINSRFSDETAFFWDERAASLEVQVIDPIQDHIEMGFSGADGNPGMEELEAKLADIDYYRELFTLAYGNAEISQSKIQRSLAQFVRSIQSFDSKYDEGLNLVTNDLEPFPNFTPEENLGKSLFLNPTQSNGAGCGDCHRSPEFDIDPASANNGVIGVAGSVDGFDITNTRAPTLRDIFNANGELNGPLMHDGSFITLEAVIEHYNALPESADNDGLDNRLTVPGGLQQLNLSDDEKEALIAFIKTLSGSSVYYAEQYSDPFQ